MRCSSCGHESLPGASFCLNCGNALAPAQTPAAPAGLPVICMVCRGENPAGMKFCRNCGAALAAPPPPAPAPMATPMPVAVGAPMMAPAGPTPAPAPPTSINCPRCGTVTPLGFAYCQQCGLHLQAIAPTDPGALRNRPASKAPPVVAQPGIDPQAATLAQPDGNRASAVNAAPVTSPAAPSLPPAIAATARPSGTAWGTAVLVNRDGSDGQRFALSSEDTIVGRAGADIAFDDDRFLARQHARIARGADGAITVHPIDTVNGVYRKTEGAVELADGATILVGREVLRFERVTPEERTQTPLVRHGVALFGSPPREPWGRLLQLIPSGGLRDVRHLVGGEVVLGREEGEIVYRDDAFMSRRHAALNWDGKRVTLTDLGSSNGTFVRLAGPTAIKHGDQVRMGDQLLRIER
ncbi:MAG TPA: FHA domain-containing protein [Kofleriaceae bacterium]|nr:FHA domain-containing protein [Kofleriaceae bacterium]